MRILHINTFDHAGGAARAAFWLHSGLKKTGIESMMIVQHKSTGESAIVSKPGRMEMLLKDIRWIFDGLPLLRYPDRNVTHWSTGCFPNRLSTLIDSIDPDIIHLHWICRGLVPISEIGRICSSGRPVVWTLHDSWAFTGGCHVPGECKEYRSACGRCPQLVSNKSRDLSSKTLAKKAKKWKHNNIVVVSPSNWLADCARQSALFSANRVEVIPNGIDMQLYNPVDKKVARSILQLPDSPKKQILCGGINTHADPNKGFSMLKKALTHLINNGWQDKIEVIVYGESGLPDSDSLPVTTHFLGTLNDDVSLRLAYSAADLFVLPSLQENLPNSILESLACQTPVVAFAVSGIPDIFGYVETPFLAKPFETEDFADCITRALTDDRKPSLDRRFTQPASVAQYQSLYLELTDG